VGVQIVERWILASLRNHTFFSLTELNQTIQQLVLKLNQRPFKKLPGSRSELFQNLDKPALKALPMTPYVYAEWKLVRVHIDYHVDIEGITTRFPIAWSSNNWMPASLKTPSKCLTRVSVLPVICDPG